VLGATPILVRPLTPFIRLAIACMVVFIRPTTTLPVVHPYTLVLALSPSYFLPFGPVYSGPDALVVLARGRRGRAGVSSGQAGTVERG
jgi:hypothetical protein